MFNVTILIRLIPRAFDPAFGSLNSCSHCGVFVRQIFTRWYFCSTNVCLVLVSVLKSAPWVCAAYISNRLVFNLMNTWMCIRSVVTCSMHICNIYTYDIFTSFYISVHFLIRQTAIFFRNTRLTHVWHFSRCFTDSSLSLSLSFYCHKAADKRTGKKYSLLGAFQILAERSEISRFTFNYENSARSFFTTRRDIWRDVHYLGVFLKYFVHARNLYFGVLSDIFFRNIWMKRSENRRNKQTKRRWLNFNDRG